MLRLSNVRKDFGDRTLFKNVSLVIAPGDRIGLVGPNGGGKSTLLKICAGLVEPDEGSIKLDKGLRVAYLPQLADVFLGELCGRLSRTSGTSESAKLSNSAESNNSSESSQSSQSNECGEYGESCEPSELRQSGESSECGESSESRESSELRESNDCSESGESCESRESSELCHSNKSSEFCEPGESCESSKPDNNTTGGVCGERTGSGGEVQQAALAHILRADASILLLDEPTNNLDQRSIRWLEGHLRRSNAAIVIASHDRQFLDNLTERTIELDTLKECCTEYGGNFSYYQAEKEKERALQWRMYTAQQTKIKQLTGDIAQVKQQATQTERATQNDYLRGRAKKVAAKAKARESRLNKMLLQENKCEKPRDRETIRISIHAANSPSLALLEVRDGDVLFGKRTVLKQVSLQLYSGQRILLAGRNGSGKSTLMRLFAGEIELDAGHLFRSSHCRIGYLPQKHDEFPHGQSVLDWFVENVSQSRRVGASLCDRDSGLGFYPSDIGKVRTFLNRFLFTRDDVFKSVSDLSCGERMRLKFASVMADTPNLVLLDEPTNHLDLDSIRILEQAFATYQGSLVFVSHDRAFQRSLRPQVRWSVEDGAIVESVFED